MEYEYYDTKTSSTMNLNLGDISYASLSKETFRQVCEMFESDEELGKLVRSFVNSVWGEGYDYNSLDNNYQKAMLRSMVENVARHACPMFKKRANLKNQGGNRKETTVQSKKPRGLSEITEN